MKREGDHFDHERHVFYSPLSGVEQQRLEFLKWLMNKRGSDDVLAASEGEFLPKMAHERDIKGSAQIEYTVLSHFSGVRKPTKIALEAGHIYVDPTMSPLGEADRTIALSGAALGARIHDLLSRHDIQVSRWVFVDDLHVNGGNATDPKLNADALSLVDRIREVSPDRLVTMRKGYSLRPTDPNEPNILLADRTKSKEPVNPKCSALDAALTLQKVKFLTARHPAGEVACINVLPEIYAPQQVNTREILAAAGYRNILLMSVLYADAPPAYSVSRNFPNQR